MRGRLYGAQNLFFDCFYKQAAPMVLIREFMFVDTKATMDKSIVFQLQRSGLFIAKGLKFN